MWKCKLRHVDRFLKELHRAVKTAVCMGCCGWSLLLAQVLWSCFIKRGAVSSLTVTSSLLTYCFSSPTLIPLVSRCRWKQASRRLTGSMWYWLWTKRSSNFIKTSFKDVLKHKIRIGTKLRKWYVKGDLIVYIVFILHFLNQNKWNLTVLYVCVTAGVSEKMHLFNYNLLVRCSYYCSACRTFLVSKWNTKLVRAGFSRVLCLFSDIQIDCNLNPSHTIHSFNKVLYFLFLLDQNALKLSNDSLLD